MRNWNVADTEFPVHGTPREKLGFAIKYALLAPPPHPWQSWGFRLSESAVELSADDVEARETMISCGAALHNFKLGLRHFGCLGRIDLFPDLDHPGLVARIGLGTGREPAVQEQKLFSAMQLPRRTVALAGGMQLPDEFLNVLTRPIAGDRGWLELPRSEASQLRLLELARERFQVRDVHAHRVPPANPLVGDDLGKRRRRQPGCWVNSSRGGRVPCLP